MNMPEKLTQPALLWRALWLKASSKVKYFLLVLNNLIFSFCHRNQRTLESQWSRCWSIQFERSNSKICSKIFRLQPGGFSGVPQISTGGTSWRRQQSGHTASSYRHWNRQFSKVEYRVPSASVYVQQIITPTACASKPWRRGSVTSDGMTLTLLICLLASSSPPCAVLTVIMNPSPSSLSGISAWASRPGLEMFHSTNVLMPSLRRRPWTVTRCR